MSSVRSWLRIALLGPGLAACGGGPPSPEYGYPSDDTLRLTDIQVRGTHNSYHIAAASPIAPELNYTFPPLEIQLRQYGVRAFELDLHHSAARGYEVFHAPFAGEDMSTCRRFADCLSALKTWSDKNRGHLTLFITMEFKDDFDSEKITDYPGIEAEILSIWPRERLLVPDDVQGDAATLAEAVQTRGWPTLRTGRDKALFMLIDRDDSLTGGPPHRSQYTQDGTTLRHRIFFVTEDDNPDSPLAAMIKIEDSTDVALTALAHQRGAMTAQNVDRVDAASAQNVANRQSALSGGFQLMMSDFLAPPDGPDFFRDAATGPVARCNPVTAAADCTPQALEDLARVRAYLLTAPQ